MNEAELFGGLIDAGDMDEMILTGRGYYGARIHQDGYPDNPAELMFDLLGSDFSEFNTEGHANARAHQNYNRHGHMYTALQAFTGGYRRRDWNMVYPSGAAVVRFLRIKGYPSALLDSAGEILTPTAEMGEYGWHTGNYDNDRGIYGMLIDTSRYHANDADGARGMFESYVEANRAYQEGDVWEVDVIDPDGDTIETAQGYYGYHAGGREEMIEYAAAVAHGDAERRGKQEAAAAAAKATRKAAEAGRKADEAAAIAAAYDANLETRIAELTEALAAAKETRRHNIARARVTIAAAANATTREEAAA